MRGIPNTPVQVHLPDLYIQVGHKCPPLIKQITAGVLLTVHGIYPSCFLIYFYIITFYVVAFMY